MSPIEYPKGFRIERLMKSHPRRSFTSGQVPVDDWLATKALQNQNKHLSNTKALIDDQGAIAGYYTLVTSQIEVGDLPPVVGKSLPNRLLPIAIIAWLGISTVRQGQGLGGALFAQALQDCYEASKVFAFVAVIIDCIDDSSKSFFQQFDFAELPGRPYRLYLSTPDLEDLIES